MLEIDFLRDGANLMAPKPSAAPERSSERSSTPSTALRVVRVEHSGRADAVAVWFDLWLDGERTERDVVSTRPERSNHRDSSGWVSFVVASLVPLCCVDDMVKAFFDWFVQPYIMCRVLMSSVTLFPGAKSALLLLCPSGGDAPFVVVICPADRARFPHCPHLDA